MRNELKVICLSGVLLLSGCNVMKENLRKDLINLLEPKQDPCFPAVTLKKGMGVKILPDGLEIELPTKNGTAVNYHLVVSSKRGENVFLMMPVEVYLDRNGDEIYDEYFMIDNQ